MLIYREKGKGIFKKTNRRICDFEFSFIMLVFIEMNYTNLIETKIYLIRKWDCKEVRYLPIYSRNKHTNFISLVILLLLKFEPIRYEI